MEEGYMRKFKVEVEIIAEDWDKEGNAISETDVSNLVHDSLIRIDKVENVIVANVVQLNYEIP